MIERFRALRLRAMLAYPLARGAAGAAARRLDTRRPATWEFSGFSQNGEDGIIDFLLATLVRSNRYFIEIGAANGLENNTTWLAIVRRYSGLMIDADAAAVRRLTDLRRLALGLVPLQLLVSPETVQRVVELALHRDPDLLSVDIDGNDYYLVKSLLERGLRPKVVVVEYNSAFGPDRAVTVPYRANHRWEIGPDDLYYGVSVSGWRRTLEPQGYRFVTVDQNGVNAFFIDPAATAADIAAIDGTAFAENFWQRQRFRTDWSGQFERLRGRPLFEI